MWRALRSKVALFIVSALTTVAIAVPSDANAAWKALSAYACLVYSTGDQQDLYDGGPWGGGVWAESLYGYHLRLFCPVPEDDRLPRSAMNQLMVYGYNGSLSEQVSFKVCIDYGTTHAGACGLPQTASAGGYYMFGISPGTLWSGSNPEFFPYLYADLPSWTGTYPSVLTGYWIY